MSTGVAAPARLLAMFAVLCSAQSAAEPRFAFATTPGRLPKVLAKASPRARIYILPGAAWESNDPARADELIALTKRHLEPAALYQAEKTAGWIRLKAAVKEREAKRTVEWARQQIR